MAFRQLSRTIPHAILCDVKLRNWDTWLGCRMPSAGNPVLSINIKRLTNVRGNGWFDAKLPGLSTICDAFERGPCKLSQTPSTKNWRHRQCKARTRARYASCPGGPYVVATFFSGLPRLRGQHRPREEECARPLSRRAIASRAGSALLPGAHCGIIKDYHRGTVREGQKGRGVAKATQPGEKE